MMTNVLLCFFLVTTIGLAIVCLNMHRKMKSLIPASNGQDEAQTVETLVRVNQNHEESSEVGSPDKTSILIIGNQVAEDAELVASLSEEFAVQTSSDGLDGLEKACETTPDIVISDVMMAGFTGYELCARLRENVATSHIAVILVSALCERENIIYGLEAGADDYVSKPLDIEILKTRIHALLKRRQAYREQALTSNVLSKLEYKTKLDKEFMDNVMAILESKIPDSSFIINDLCAELAMSRSSVFNKIKALTGKGPNELIKILRLNKAHELLLSREHTVGEVAFLVGFSDPKYFSTCFKKQFGVSPNKV